jgi:hypothetical protein
MGMVKNNNISVEELEFMHESCVHEPNNIYYDYEVLGLKSLGGPFFGT